MSVYIQTCINVRVLGSRLLSKLNPNVNFNNKPTIVKHVSTSKGHFTRSHEWFVESDLSVDILWLKTYTVH